MSPDSAREIVRRSGSNLAYALAVLPRAVQRDMEVFYAFCRVVDDLVDDPHLHPEERRAGLDRWRALVEGQGQDPRPGLEAEFEDLRRRRSLQREDLLAILDGMEMDLAPRLFETEGELRHYCHHVAGAVGLVSATIFGCSHPDSRLYAEELGQALQWTNILRDVGEDAERGRLFLPLEFLRRFELSAEDVLSRSPDPIRFQRLMRHAGAVARARYNESRAIFASLPSDDRAALRSAELMRRIYSAILDEMERDGYRVISKRYRLGKLVMLGELFRAKFLS